jgi:hypothetical protein
VTADDDFLLGFAGGQAGGGKQQSGNQADEELGFHG